LDSRKFLDDVKVVCRRLVTELFPEDVTIFDDVWYALLPLLEKWQKSRPRARRFSTGDLSVTSALGFGEARDWALPITVMTVVATMLKMWESTKRLEEKEVRSTVVKFADNFGAPAKLQELLAEKVLPFCLGVYEDLKWDADAGELAKKRDELEQAMSERGGRDDYAVLTHRDEKAKFMTLEEVRDFKKKNKPKDYHVWVDELQLEVFIKNKPLPIKPRLRKVLSCLVELKGQRVTHFQLVETCGETKSYAYDDRPRISRLWVEALRKAGGGILKHALVTKEGGHSYEGPKSFCIIKALRRIRSI
jgi:hypothetical protein